jgi:hypothetical protein
LDAIPDVAGLRAVRAKVHAEASPVCPSCGRHHLLDGHCSGATVVVHDVDDPQRSGDHGESADAHADSPQDATTPTQRDAPERALRARRLFRSAIAFVGLDPASYGAVDDVGRGTAADADGQDWLGLDIGPRRPRVQRIAAFLGVDVPIAPSPTDATPTDPTPTATTWTDSDEAEADAGDDNTAGDELAPVDPIAVAESPTDGDAEEMPMIDVPDDTTRHYWRRSDDDILYRPSRRPRSPRRAWRDRITSRG